MPFESQRIKLNNLRQGSPTLKQFPIEYNYEMRGPPHCSEWRAICRIGPFSSTFGLTWMPVKSEAAELAARDMITHLVGNNIKSIAMGPLEVFVDSGEVNHQNEQEEAPIYEATLPSPTSEAAIDSLMFEDMVDVCSEESVRPFLRMTYLLAQQTLRLARTAKVLHVPGVYIARQAVRLVLLLNHVIGQGQAPTREQLSERGVLQSQIATLERGVKIWGSNLGTADDSFRQEEYHKRVQGIENQYDVFFKSRFYFDNSGEPQKDSIFPNLLSYDYKSTGIICYDAPGQPGISIQAPFLQQGGSIQESQHAFIENVENIPPLMGGESQRFIGKSAREDTTRGPVSASNGINLAPEEGLGRALQFNKQERQGDEIPETLSCPVSGCGKTFKTEHWLIRHITLNHPGRPYVCIMGSCNKSFATRRELDTHVELHDIKRDANAPYMPSVTPPLYVSDVVSMPALPPPYGKDTANTATPSSSWVLETPTNARIYLSGGGGGGASIPYTQQLRTLLQRHSRQDFRYLMTTSAEGGVQWHQAAFYLGENHAASSAMMRTVAEAREEAARNAYPMVASILDSAKTPTHSSAVAVLPSLRYPGKDPIQSFKAFIDSHPDYRITERHVEQDDARTHKSVIYMGDKIIAEGNPSVTRQISKHSATVLALEALRDQGHDI